MKLIRPGAVVAAMCLTACGVSTMSALDDEAGLQAGPGATAPHAAGAGGSAAAPGGGEPGGGSPGGSELGGGAAGGGTGQPAPGEDGGDDLGGGPGGGGGVGGSGTGGSGGAQGGGRELPDAGAGGGAPGCTPGVHQSCPTACGSAGEQTCSATRTWSACQPPVERCGNGVDDDCDGQVDGHDLDCPPTVRTCEASEGDGCNGDEGYGTHCSAADNTGGCSASRFHAWCNRRNPATPTIWDDWVRNWVDSRCDGALSESGTQYDTWSCLSSDNTRYSCTTPLVLQFDLEVPVELSSGQQPFAFTPGEGVRSDWPTARTPWLVRDLDRDGRISDGRELFGSNTRLPGGRAAVHGFEALAALDDNHDGVIDARDAAFAELGLWHDRDGDRRTGPGELVTLRQAGVTSLSLAFTRPVRCDRRGNCQKERAAFTWVDAHRHQRSGAVIDLYLSVQPAPVCLATSR